MKSNKKNKLTYSLVFSILFVLIVYFILNQLRLLPTPSDIKAEKGIIELPYAPNSTHLLILKGEWEFYYDQIIYPIDFNASSKYIQPMYVKVPSVWTNYNIEGQTFDRFANVTYRVILKNITPNQLYGLSIKNMHTAYRCYANGELIASNGKVGDTWKESIPQFLPTTAYIKSTTNQIELIFHVSNNVTLTSGLWQNIAFGLATPVSQYHQRLILFDFFLLTTVLIIGLYLLVLFFIMGRGKETLYFALFCLVLALKSGFSEMQSFYLLLPDFPFIIGIYLSYAALTFALPLLVLYFKEVFPKYIPITLVRISIAFCIIEILSYPFVPLYIMAKYFYIYQIAILTIGFTCLYFIISAKKEQPEESGYIATGFLFLISLGLNDFLHSLHIIYTGYIMNIGLFVFLFSQAALIAYRFNQTFMNIEELKVSLESKVNDRTKELIEEKGKLELLTRLDDLTQLYNRKFILKSIHMLQTNLIDTQSTFSMIHSDIDYFNDINDTYGYTKGDESLVAFADLLKSKTPTNAICGRLSNEEFLILLPDTKEMVANGIAETLKRCVESLSIPSPIGPIKMTAIFTVIEVNQSYENYDSLIQNAHNLALEKRMRSKTQISRAPKIKKDSY